MVSWDLHCFFFLCSGEWMDVLWFVHSSEAHLYMFPLWKTQDWRKPIFDIPPQPEHTSVSVNCVLIFSWVKASCSFFWCHFSFLRKQQWAEADSMQQSFFPWIKIIFQMQINLLSRCRTLSQFLSVLNSEIFSGFSAEWEAMHALYFAGDIVVAGPKRYKV